MKTKSQLCWTCNKCTNRNLCSWVKDFKYPNGVELEDGYIVSCPEYINEISKGKQDGFVFNLKEYTKKKLDISERTYFRFISIMKEHKVKGTKKYTEFLKIHIQYSKYDKLFIPKDFIK